MKKVLLLGRIAIDFNPTDYYSPLSESSNFNKYLGGSPANIAIGLARLGVSVEFLGKVSNDQFGDFVINYFDENKISTKGIVRAKNGEKLGLTFTEMKSESESSILMYREGVADLNFMPSEINEEIFEDVGFLIVSGTALSKSPSREAALLSIEIAKQNGIEIIFDIDYRPYSWASSEETSLYYGLVAKQSDYIIGSREEITLVERFYLPGNVNDQVSADYLFNCGAKIIIIKHGKKGSMVFTKKSNYNVLPYTIKAIKGFGGGDAYASAFVASIIRGKSIKEALFYGTIHASILISSHSCSQDMKSFEEIDAYITENEILIDELVKELNV